MSAQKRFLTIAEFAEFSGYSDKTVRRRIVETRLPFYQPGGPGTKILIPSDALDRAHQGTTAETAPPSNAGCDQALADPRSKTTRLPGPKPQWR